MAKKLELKQYGYSTTERGMQIEIIFCAWKWSDVTSLLGISLYYAKNYVTSFKPRDEECIKHPMLRFAKFTSGELCYAKPEWRGKLIKYIDLCNFINEYRKVCGSYQATMDRHEKLINKIKK